MRLGYLGPDGTFSAEALRSWPESVEHELVALPGIFETVLAVQHGEVDRGLVPIENSLEGGVNATLDALVGEAEDVEIVGELVHPVRICLLGVRTVGLSEIASVVSHPQPSGQSARFLREQLPDARVLAAASTAEAVRTVMEAGESSTAALGTRLAAELYGAEVLRAGIEDMAGNETRFVWLARRGAGAATREGRRGPWKTSLVFWGVGTETPGWLVRCLSEFASRGVNLVRIESRPRRQGLGRYMFFTDLEGGNHEPAVTEAIAALAERAEHVRVLGSYPGA